MIKDRDLLIACVVLVRNAFVGAFVGALTGALSVGVHLLLIGSQIPFVAAFLSFGAMIGAGSGAISGSLAATRKGFAIAQALVLIATTIWVVAVIMAATQFPPGFALLLSAYTASAIVGTIAGRWAVNCGCWQEIAEEFAKQKAKQKAREKAREKAKEIAKRESP